MDNKNRRYLKLIFFLSGFSALCYQIALNKIFITITGSYIISAASVTFAFLSGLATGGIFFGSAADKTKTPYKLLIAIEALSALYIIASKQMFYPLSGIFFKNVDFVGNVNLIKFAFTFLSIFPYTFLIGGTLPVFVKMFFDGTAGKKRDFSLVYGINTLGAAAGAFFAGFYFLNHFGISRTVFISFWLSLLNLFIVLFLLMQKRQITKAEELVEKAAPSSRNIKIFIISIALSGFVSLSVEILWIRILTPIVSSSIYTISLTLVFYLAATALGSFIYKRTNLKSEQDALCILNYISCILIVLTLYVGKSLPRLYFTLFSFLGGGFLSLISALCVLLLILAAPLSALWGFHYALVNAHLITSYKNVSKRVGSLYFINVISSVTGIVVTTFFLLPNLGLYATLKILAYIMLAFSAIAYFLLDGQAAPGRIKLLPALPLIVIGAALLVLLPKEDIKMMNSGIYMMSGSRGFAEIEKVIGEQDVLFYESGFSSDVIVVKKGAQKYIIAGGKPVSNSVLDKNTQFMLGHLPMLAATKIDSVLIIGFGSGVTAGDASLYDPSIIDAVEISKGVVSASKLFSGINNSVNDSDNLRLFIEDGRFFIRNSRENYDVIISQPSNPWIPGAAMLYTEEFFSDCRKKLNEGGVMAQWYQLYGTSKADLAAEIATFTKVFDNVTIWSFLPGDIIMLGHKGDFGLDVPGMKKRYGKEKIKRRLGQIRINSVADVFAGFLCEGRDVLDEGAEKRIVTDDKNFLEYNLAKSFFKNTAVENFRYLLAKRKSAIPETLTTDTGDLARGAFFINVSKGFAKKGVSYKVKELLERGLGLANDDAAGIDLLGDMYYKSNEFMKAVLTWEMNLHQNNVKYKKKAIIKIGNAKSRMKR